VDAGATRRFAVQTAFEEHPICGGSGTPVPLPQVVREPPDGSAAGHGTIPAGSTIYAERLVLRNYTSNDRVAHETDRATTGSTGANATMLRFARSSTVTF